MDFACIDIDVKQVLKCTFGLTKAGCAVLASFRGDEWLVSEEVASRCGYDLATVQRSLKHLSERGVLIRRQQNRPSGGYEFAYTLVSKKEFSSLVNKTLDSWLLEAKKEVSSWRSKQ
ncbi:MAG: MarR family transcriptional regulator [Candidatus Woesearchaeota archaeon]